MEYKMIIDTLDKDNKKVKSEIVDNKDLIIQELAYTLKEGREYSIVFSKNGLYDIVSYTYIDTKNGRITIRRTFELDLL